LPQVYAPVNRHLTCIDVHFGPLKIRDGVRFEPNARHDRGSALPYDLDRLGVQEAISAAGRAAQEALK